MRSMAQSKTNDHSTLLMANFAESVEAQVLQHLADNCADDNLMPPDIFERLRQSVPDLSSRTLSKPIEYDLAVEARTESGAAKVVCDTIVTAEVELCIRHGTNLLYVESSRWPAGKLRSTYSLEGRCWKR